MPEHSEHLDTRWTTDKSVRTDVYQDYVSYKLIVRSKNKKGLQYVTFHSISALSDQVADHHHDPGKEMIELAIMEHKMTKSWVELLDKSEASHNPATDIYMQSGGYIKNAASPDGMDTFYNPMGPLVKLFANIREVVVHPISKKEMTLSQTIMNLNDFHGWSRGQIADWLESLDIDLSAKEKINE